MRQPRPALALVHAEALEAALDAVGEIGRAARRIVEDEHPDRTGLAVAHNCELERLRRRGLTSKERDNGIERGSRLGAEKRQRDVELRERPAARELTHPPAGKAAGRVVGHVEGEKEPDPLICADGSARFHA